MKVSIVIPTFNEKQNIEILLPRLESEIKKIPDHDFYIVVVDDKSPDGTSESVNNFKKNNKNVHLVTGEKEGYGVACLRGFKYSVNELKADVIISMDADLSHPPELISNFMKTIEEGYDFVIGSRYVEGGGTPDWNIKRKIISRGGNSIVRVIAGIRKIRDCTSGYRAIRASQLGKIETKYLYKRGYAFLTNILFELYMVGAKTKEIPLVFHDRKYGETKLKSRDMMEFFANAFKLRFRSSKRMIKFAIVGGSGIFVNLSIFTLVKLILYSWMGKTNVTLLASSLSGDELSIIYNFFLNHFWTFKGSSRNEHILKKLLKFHVVALTSIVINNSVLFLLHVGLGVNDVLSKFIGIVLAFMWNYIMNVKWTWREGIR